MEFDPVKYAEDVESTMVDVFKRESDAVRKAKSAIATRYNLLECES